MMKIQSEPFNLLKYARQNNLKLIASAKLKDGDSVKFFAKDDRIDCFVLDKNRQIVGGKGARGNELHLFDTVANIIDQIKDKIVSVSTYVK